MDRETVALEIFGLLVKRKMDTFGDQKDFCYEVADWAIARTEAAEQRIAELEKLVPDEVILECAAFIMRTTCGAEATPITLEEYATAVRRYKEATDG